MKIKKRAYYNIFKDQRCSKSLNLTLWLISVSICQSFWVRPFSSSIEIKVDQMKIMYAHIKQMINQKYTNKGILFK